MYGQNGNEVPYNYYPSQFEGHSEFAPPVAHHRPMHLAPLVIPEEHDSFSALRSELGYTSSCSSPTMIHSDVYYPIHSSPPSTVDLQGLNLGQRVNSPRLATESSIIESMNSRASPYSPDEKKERIERYKSKRYLRNFNKKIKYECRKTLADSRPRIRGRFARNDEIENKTPQSQWDPPGVEQYDEYDENWIGFLDAFSANVMP